MNAAREGDLASKTKISAYSAIVFFFVTLGRVFYLHGGVHPPPCHKISAVDNAIVAVGSGAISRQFLSG